VFYVLFNALFGYIGTAKFEEMKHSASGWESSQWSDHEVSWPATLNHHTETNDFVRESSDTRKKYRV